jgi:superfamily I DNA/RNA helicase
MEIVLTKEFKASLMALREYGKKNQYTQSMAILSELRYEVKISKAFRSETRIPNSYKYELPEGYRIVLQKVEGAEDTMIALTVGSHDEVDKYLERHKGWIFNPQTHGLKEMRLSSAYDEQVNIVRSPELNPQKLLTTIDTKQSIFQELDTDLLIKAGVAQTKIEQALSLTNPDSLEVMEFLESLNPKTADLLLSFITGSEETRIEIVSTLKGEREYHTHISQAILSGLGESSDQFINLNELPEEQRAFDSLSFEDWMLFLHPDQKSLVTKEFNGPVRIRGVSGSGKTVVAIHRARQIARKILQDGSNEYVLFLTFNKSLAELVDNLIKHLCLSAEYAKIHVSTIDKWCKDYVTFRFGSLPPWQETVIDKIWVDSITTNLEALKKVNLCQTGSYTKDIKSDRDMQFLKDEVDFIFGKFIHNECDNYLSCDRTGRVHRLSDNQRACILELYKTYHIGLIDHKQYFSKELNRLAFDLLRKGELPEYAYHSIIVDEVQDLSEIELRVFKELSGFEKERLFLVGDGAQRIYTRGYSMKNIGINVVGRSFLLKKNYRNTREIMKTATLLMETQGVGKYDEDPAIAQTIASFSSHSAEKPLLMIADTPNHEWNAIAREIRYLIKTLNISPHEICCLARVNWERQGIKNALQELGIKSVDYRADGIGANDCIKISSLHNSKGHEFRIIFIAGLFEGAIPPLNSSDPEDLEKEAALLYVAITRAKQLLYLSYPMTDQYGHILKASRFLEDMRDALEVMKLC